MKVPITRSVQRIITAIHEAPEPMTALAICRATGRWPGTVYPALDRLERAGWIRGGPHPTRDGARVYHLTHLGQIRAGLEPSTTPE
ncbi:PadR family transcriptional regulator [Streptomyces sp. WAC04189]|uniref:PadR family transcriptional regulator n=1 Tax=Streptomyces sp. WAC04189 TaxID=2487411 RepID=UPI000FB147B0|nr:PadR family transcriptional regulator [Streptomyces sp. WAC04189]RSR98053.1 PadR family transcriptional regulator [Streptomyces sp. WAC04189]